MKKIQLEEDQYTFIVNGHVANYNLKLAGKTGLSVLDKPCSFIFKLINGERTATDLLKYAKKKDPSASLQGIKKILKLLEENSLIRGKKKISNIAIHEKKQLGVWFHLTNQCNLRCKYCFVNKTSSSMPLSLAKEIITKLLTDAKKNKFEKVRIVFAGGEPLLEFKKIKYLVPYGKTYAKKIKMELKFDMITNGILITEDVTRFIKTNNIDVGVSLDGLQKYNDLQRVFSNGLGSFNHVISGIENLIKHSVHFNVLITVTANNVYHLPEFVKYCIKRKIKFVIAFYRENGCSTDTALKINEELLIKNLKKSYRYIYANSEPFRLGLFKKIAINTEQNYICGIGSSFLSVTHEGLIADCPMMLDKPIGSIKDEDVIQTMIRKSSVYKKAPITTRSLVCKACKLKEICRGGCPLIFEKQVNLSEPPSYCKTYKNIFNELMRLEAKRLIKINSLA